MDYVERVLIAVLSLAVCLSIKSALDLHCKISCKEDDDALSGYWNEKSLSCNCIYQKQSSFKINGVLLNKGFKDGAYGSSWGEQERTRSFTED